MINGKYLGKDGRYYENYDNKLLADQREDLYNRARKERQLEEFRKSKAYQGSNLQKIDDLGTSIIYNIFFKENHLKTIGDLLRAMFLWALIIPPIVFFIGMFMPLFTTKIRIFSSQELFFSIIIKVWLVIFVIYTLALIGNNKK